MPAAELSPPPSAAGTAPARLTPPPSPADPVRDFAAFAAGVGLAIPGSIQPDRDIHRFHVEGDRPGSKNGWYVLYADGVAAGVVGTWRGDAKHKWCSSEVESLAPAERRAWRCRIDEAKAKQAEERARAAEVARRVAAEVWACATPLKEHQYLAAKRVRGDGVGLRVTRENVLLVPLLDVAGTLHSLQRIYPNGDKRFLGDGAVAGHFFVIGGRIRDHELAYVCEGLATALSVYAATGGPVVVALNSGNLRAVCEALRGKYPGLRLTVAADNDRHSNVNDGLVKGRAAAKAVGADLVFPEFEGSEGTDFNDLWVAKGADEVRRQLTMLAWIPTLDPGINTTGSIRGRI